MVTLFKQPYVKHILICLFRENKVCTQFLASRFIPAQYLMIPECTFNVQQIHGTGERETSNDSRDLGSGLSAAFPVLILRVKKTRGWPKSSPSASARQPEPWWMLGLCSLPAGAQVDSVRSVTQPPYLGECLKPRGARSEQKVKGESHLAF